VDEHLLRAALRYENGRAGLEAGIQDVRRLDEQNADAVDAAAFCDPTMPQGAAQHARLARMIVGSVQRWVFSDPWRRREWLKQWAKEYHAGGSAARTDEERAAANRKYSHDLAAVWAEERAAP
jgi:hypothetical protein